MFINPCLIDSELHDELFTTPEPLAEMLRSRMLHEVLADTLRARILNGELVSGEPMDEHLLAREFGTQRPPVHEAIKTLAREGLIDVDATGCRVATPAADELAFAEALLADLAGGATRLKVTVDEPTLKLAASGNPTALPAAPAERLLVAALLPVWRRLALARPRHETAPSLP